MLTPRHKKALVLILSLLFISLVFYVYYQNNYNQLFDQRTYETKKTVIQVHTTTAISFLDERGNPTPSGNESSYQTNKARSAYLTSQQSRAPVIKEGCIPYLKDLFVVPVPQHECDQPHVVMHDGGRLGNNLCQYASLYLLRHLYGVRVSQTI
ncbi:hypothetical protein E2C01_035016 [Portunus trituberculatus]|uniref:Uncharacterized protein n=1 Tax=Portunus trituberculatus TaxID=210409 RepID=A0A5B7F7Y3_PORTR|nr:hypothetical protein [Portunus trituberculatus]